MIGHTVTMKHFVARVIEIVCCAFLCLFVIVYLIINPAFVICSSSILLRIFYMFQFTVSPFFCKNLRIHTRTHHCANFLATDWLIYSYREGGPKLIN